MVVSPKILCSVKCPAPMSSIIWSRYKSHDLPGTLLQKEYFAYIHGFQSLVRNTNATTWPTFPTDTCTILRTFQFAGDRFLLYPFISSWNILVMYSILNQAKYDLLISTFRLSLFMELFDNFQKNRYYGSTTKKINTVGSKYFCW